MDIQKIQQLLDRCAGEMTGRASFYFQDLATGESAGHDAGAVMPSASVFKIFVLAELLRQVREGRFALSDRYPLSEADKSNGSGVLQLMEDGLRPTLRDYATLMIILSDNTAADFLFRLVGRENIIDHVLRPLGLEQTKCDLSCRDLIALCYGGKAGLSFAEACRLDENASGRRNLAPYTGGLELNDETSARDAARMLEQFYRGTWVDEEMSRQALDILLACQTNGRIPHLLPLGTPVAHKTGSMDRVVNDAGIVFTDKGDYLLTLFYNGNTAGAEEYDQNPHGYFGETRLAQLSLAIFEEYTAS